MRAEPNEAQHGGDGRLQGCGRDRLEVVRERWSRDVDDDGDACDASLSPVHMSCFIARVT
jgi:hypothetical protein